MTVCPSVSKNPSWSNTSKIESMELGIPGTVTSSASFVGLDMV